MFRSDDTLRRVRAHLLCLAATLAAVAAAEPAAAQHERSCHFVVEVNPTEGGLQNVLYSFRVFTTVERLTQANDARREVRQHVTDCVRGHWNDRNETRPYACQDYGRIDMAEYPFSNMFEQIRQDICGANPDALRLPVNIEMWIRGERGCLERDDERGVVDPAAYASIASNFQFNCPIPDAGGWEMSGPQPPANPPLPNTRLPGNDIAVQPVADWQECWTLCEETDACRAWTFRAADTSGPGSPALCLLKAGAGAQVPDTCCQSGIR